MEKLDNHKILEKRYIIKRATLRIRPVNAEREKNSQEGGVELCILKH